VNRAYRLRCRAALLACLVLLAPALLAPRSALAPRGRAELFERPAHYYKARGIGLQVKWEVPLTTVEEGRELTATLVVGSARYPVLNPTEVVKPDLSKLPRFANLFSVTDVKDPPPQADAKEVRFTYKLKPRNRLVTEVPPFEFYYLNPSAPPNKDPYRYTVAASITISVTEPPPKPVIPMPEADRLFDIATGPDVLGAPFVPCQWAWLAAGLFGPLAALGWFLVWRRIYPNAARLAHIRRSRAARRATDAIRRAHRTPDPPATIAAAVLGYLRARFPLPDSAVTPSEIGAALVEADVPHELAEQIADVFRACDRARFAPADDEAGALAAGAETAVARLEALA
jgi:hypothetical protein